MNDVFIRFELVNAAARKKGLLFRQVRNDLLKRISSGEFPVHSQLPTERELIRKYGVSITTIRKAVQMLSDEGVVSKKQGVGTFVVALPSEGETPLLHRKSPPERKTLRIGVFLPDLMKLREDGDSRHWMLNVRRLNGIYSRAANANAAVFVHGFGEKVDLRAFDGVIHMPSYAVDLFAEDLREKLYWELEALHVPQVTISEFDPRFVSKYWVAEMIELEFFKALHYLISRGLRRIALIGPELNWGNPRYSAYRKVLEREGIAFDGRLLSENPPSDSRSGREACRVLFSRFSSVRSALEAFDVIFCTTDLQAYGVLSFLRENGISVPGDLCVMGVDNLPESAALPIPLSSMEFSGPAVGAKAMDLLLDVLDGREADGLMVSCPGKIVERESTMRTVSTPREQPGTAMNA